MKIMIQVRLLSSKSILLLTFFIPCIFVTVYVVTSCDLGKGFSHFNSIDVVVCFTACTLVGSPGSVKTISLHDCGLVNSIWYYR
jgi:hypothetical protein